MDIKDTVTQLIGNTPLLRLHKMEERFGAGAEIVAKVEMFNPAGSIKDRVGYNMVIEAEKSGRLKPGEMCIRDRYFFYISSISLIYFSCV